MASQGVGARLIRKEDDRLMRGRGQFVADIRLPGMKDVAFVRSPLAHARIRGISIPAEYRSITFTAAELAGVKPIRAVSGLRGFKVSEQPPLAIRQGAPCRRAGGHVRRRHAGGSRGHRAGRHARSRGVASGARHAGGAHRTAPRWCMSTGPTTYSSRPSSMSTSARRSMRRSRSRARSAPRGNAWRRSKDAAWSPSGTRAWSN